MAGESARREYQRRRALHAQRRRRALPLFFAMVLAAGVVGYLAAERFAPGHSGVFSLLSATLVAVKLGVELAPRASTTAFAKGAEGEAAVGKLLDSLAEHGCLAVHDRLLPRGPQLDHVAVGPAGVFTIDAKRYQGKLVARRDGGIRIAGRDKTTLLVQAQKQAGAIEAHFATQPGAVPRVTPVLCFVGTELSRHHMTVDGVDIVTRRGLKRLLTARPVLEPPDVTRIAAYLDHSLRPAARV